MNGSTATAKKKKIKISLKKVKAASGYQIQYSTNKKYSKNKMKILITKSNNATLKGISKNKKYYISARTYKIVNGKKYWSAWSGSKKA